MLVRKPDLKAKRDRKPEGKNYPNGDTYEFFKAAHPDTELSLSDIQTIIKSFTLKVRDIVMSERDGFEITGFAHVIIISRKGNRRAMNMKASIEKGYRIDHLNFETDGLRCIIKMSVANRKFNNMHKKAWEFTACRPFKREASKRFKTNYYKFMEIRGSSNAYSKIIKTLI
jgi:hypothetical protein